MKVVYHLFLGILLLEVALVVLIAIKLHPQNLPIRRASWYDKQEATFSDALFALRNHLWGLEHFTISPIAADSILIPAQLFRALSVECDCMCSLSERRFVH